MLKRNTAVLVAILVLAAALTLLNFQAHFKSLLINYSVRELNTADYNKVEFVNNISPYSHSEDTVIVLSTIGDEKSYGKGKTVKDLFDTINTMEFEPNQLSVGFLIGKEEEYHNVVKFFKEYFESLSYKDFDKFIHKVTILNAPFIEKDFNQINRDDRHNDNVQRLRRRNIARSRNYVLNHSLRHEKYTLFIDADIVKVHHPQMLNKFIKSDYDIVVPRITRGNNPDYDKNSWKGERTKPTEEQYKKMDNGDWEHWDYVPRDVPGKMVHLENLLTDKSNLDYSVPLDSVGGAILFSKSVIYHQGIQFPPNYVVGTSWDRLEGYDGIETEGLCYTAKSCGYKCWGFPNLVAEHSLE